jgi:hypothetical protein
MPCHANLPPAGAVRNIYASENLLIIPRCRCWESDPRQRMESERAAGRLTRDAGMLGLAGLGCCHGRAQCPPWRARRPATPSGSLTPAVLSLSALFGNLRRICRTAGRQAGAGTGELGLGAWGGLGSLGSLGYEGDSLGDATFGLMINLALILWVGRWEVPVHPSG